MNIMGIMMIIYYVNIININGRVIRDARRRINTGNLMGDGRFNPIRWA